MSKVIQVSTLRPKYRYSTQDIINKAEELWLNDFDEGTKRMAIKLLQGAEIRERYAVAPLDVIFSDLSFEKKNELYIEAMIEMGTAVLKKALEEAELEAKEIDTLITTSCTGFMIPSVDAYIVNRLGMKQHINRLPVTEMGCAGGTSALIYANNFIKANPKSKIAIVSVETPSITFQRNDLSMENLVSTAIFADGASCAIIGESEKIRPEIMATEMYHFPHAEHLMGYLLKDSGLKIILDREVPSAITEHFPHIFHPFLERNHLKPEEIEHYMFHPGGKKIINMVKDYIGRYGKDVSDSIDVLKEHGNMSSSTILHILESFMKKEIPAGERGYMLAFGPGFMAQSLLLEWK